MVLRTLALPLLLTRFPMLRRREHAIGTVTPLRSAEHQRVANITSLKVELGRDARRSRDSRCFHSPACLQGVDACGLRAARLLCREGPWAPRKLESFKASLEDMNSKLRSQSPETCGLSLLAQKAPL